MGVAGFATGDPFRPWPAHGHAVEDSIYLAPGQRGRGIGTALPARLIATAAPTDPRHGSRHRSANGPSLRLHGRFGFAKIGRCRRVGWKFERWLDLVFLERLF
jgi:L-amino acid N-acyltransferase YncA